MSSPTELPSTVAPWQMQAWHSHSSQGHSGCGASSPWARSPSHALQQPSTTCVVFLTSEQPLPTAHRKGHEKMLVIRSKIKAGRMSLIYRQTLAVAIEITRRNRSALAIAALIRVYGCIPLSVQNCVDPLGRVVSISALNSCIGRLTGHPIQLRCKNRHMHWMRFREATILKFPN